MASLEQQTITVAMLGNPNTGKSTLFGALSGIRQRVGNYPGVTVEKKVGSATILGQDFRLIDLPGAYSLSPRSPDEMVAVDVLLGRQSDTPKPDRVLCIVDASNLQRNLYLVSQVLEFGLPTVIALNMIDVAKSKEITIDVPALEKRLGVPVVAIQANQKQGLGELGKALLSTETAPKNESPFPEAFQKEVAALSQSSELPRYLAERLLLDTSEYIAGALEDQVTPATLIEVGAARERLAGEGAQIPGIEAMSRYGWASKMLAGVVNRPNERRDTVSDKIDRVLTHKFWGSVVFLALMLLVFQSIFAWAGPLMDLVELVFGTLGDLVGSQLSEGALRSLLVDGVIGGVGGVLVFLPQIFILFAFIAILEDCGYMARAAYLMDKLMSRVGLSGKSFIPLLSSFACAIPGVMAARVIESRRDRLVTILVAPLMSCSARLPVYVLMIAAFVPAKTWLGGWVGLHGITMFAMYLVGMVVAVAVAWLLKKTMLRGETPPFVMELPSYKVPSITTVGSRVLERGWAFIRRAGTLILAVSILVWAAAYFPRGPELETRVRGEYAAEIAQLEAEASKANGGNVEELDELNETIDQRIAGEYLEQSYLGRAGKFIEPVVKPLGWDWRIGCAVIASFPAREVVVGTLGVIYHLGDETDENSATLQGAMKNSTWPDGRPVFTTPVAISIMVFFALCAQCAATLAVIKRETNSWRWPIFTFVYMTGLAYVAAFATYQIGTWVAGS